MKLYFDTRGLVWLAKYPQAGSSAGWSDFTVLDRVAAMHYIEQQHENHVHLSLDHRRV